MLSRINKSLKECDVDRCETQCIIEIHIMASKFVIIIYITNNLKHIRRK